jgi:hypothetical protein
MRRTKSQEKKHKKYQEWVNRYETPMQFEKAHNPTPIIQHSGIVTGQLQAQDNVVRAQCPFGKTIDGAIKYLNEEDNR